MVSYVRVLGLRGTREVVSHVTVSGLGRAKVSHVTVCGGRGGKGQMRGVTCNSL